MMLLIGGGCQLLKELGTDLFIDVNDKNIFPTIVIFRYLHSIDVWLFPKKLLELNFIVYYVLFNLTGSIHL